MTISRVAPEIANSAVVEGNKVPAKCKLNPTAVKVAVAAGAAAVLAAAGALYMHRRYLMNNTGDYNQEEYPFTGCGCAFKNAPALSIAQPHPVNGYVSAGKVAYVLGVILGAVYGIGSYIVIVDGAMSTIMVRMVRMQEFRRDFDFTIWMS